MIKFDKHKILEIMTYKPTLIFSLVALFIAFASCRGPKTVLSPKETITAEKFLASPFGHDESIKSFISTLPKKTTIRKLVKRNVHYPEKTDTIYQLIYKHSEVLIYKTHFNREILIAGVVGDTQVNLINGLTIGITKDQLIKSIKGIKKSEADTIKLSAPDDTRNFNFIFKKDKLKKITFTSYYD